MASSKASAATRKNSSTVAASIITGMSDSGGAQSARAITSRTVVGCACTPADATVPESKGERGSAPPPRFVLYMPVVREEKKLTARSRVFALLRVGDADGCLLTGLLCKSRAEHNNRPDITKP